MDPILLIYEVADGKKTRLPYVTARVEMIVSCETDILTRSEEMTDLDGDKWSPWY